MEDVLELDGDEEEEKKEENTLDSLLFNLTVLSCLLAHTTRGSRRHQLNEDDDDDDEDDDERRSFPLVDNWLSHVWASNFLFPCVPTGCTHFGIQESLTTRQDKKVYRLDSLYGSICVYVCVLCF
ncbi:unnamed protein product [Porites evermanni]|uniref:Uncharacterized protein n=1 Tax=Porites evermanni TaxID=104178 RepID=A0ABN8NCH8_9CNID|nr:unnamed protein product [Porites evermanni]